MKVKCIKCSMYVSQTFLILLILKCFSYPEFTKSIGGNFNLDRFEFFSKKARIVVSTAVTTALTGNSYPYESKFFSQVILYLVSLNCDLNSFFKRYSSL